MHGEHVYDSYFYILAMLFRVMCNEAFFWHLNIIEGMKLLRVSECLV